MSFLDARDLYGGYGGAPILNGCDISAERGEVVVIVGPNGAGKSTAMKAMLGLLPLTRGQVRLAERDITALSPQQRIVAGMGFVPQTNNIFASMSVLENLQMGAYLRRDDINATIREIFTLFPVLEEKRHQAAEELSGGQRQQVALGRALMTRPQVLFLDEPTAGVSPVVMKDILRNVREIAARGVAVVLVEQNARQALAMADRGYVLVGGENRYSGSGQALLQDAQVRRSFLGG